MRYIFIFLFVISLNAKDTCYTVQLVSAFKSDKSYKEISSTSYDDSCKVMEIGKSITVRCGCFEKYKEALPKLEQLKSKFSKAYIATTYKSRFETSDFNSDEQKLVAEEDKYEVIDVSDENITNNYQDENLVLDTNIEKVNKKEKIKVKEKEKEKIQVKEKKKIKVKDKKAKSKDEYIKDKYVKKRAATWKYQKYIKKLKNEKGIKPYDYRYQFGAQVSYDIGYVDEVDNSYFKNNWRRVRVYYKGSNFDEKLFHELEYSFTGVSKYKDVYIGYKDKIKSMGLGYKIKLGNIKIPFSLERYSSSKNITFTERALNDVYAESRKLGSELVLSEKIYDNHINLFASIYSNSIDQILDDDIQQPGYSTRLTYGYKFDKNHIISVGGAYGYQDIKGENVKYNQESESTFIDQKYISVKVKNVDNIVKKNIELLYIYKNYSLQGEYSISTLDALKNRYNFYGYYLEGSYFLIGNGRRYDMSNSVLKGVKPNIDTSLEFAFRYSYLDFNDKDEDENGMQKDYTFALNWYLSREIKFMLNYIIAEPIKTDNYDGRLQIVQSRVLFAF